MLVLNKIKMLFKSIIYQIYFSMKNKFSKVRIENEGYNLIVSLTSYGLRMKHVHLTIESIFHQVVMPSAVVLWITKDDESNVTPQLQRLVGRGLIIRVVDEDLRSYKKLVHTYESCLSEGKEPTIITIDDDVYYPKLFISQLLAYSKLYPESTICTRGHVLISNASGDFDYNLCMRESQKSINNIVREYNLMPTGVGGILYPFNSLSCEIADRKVFKEICADADDIWFKAITLKNGFSTVKIPEESHYPPIISALSSGLKFINVGEGKNNKRLKDVLNYFSLMDFFKV